MTDLLWPGDERAGELFSPTALLGALVEVESAWLGALRPGAPSMDGLVTGADLAAVARFAEDSGNPVVPLVVLLRERAEGEASRWLHRGLTSQDVLDTALVLCARETTLALLDHLRVLVTTLTELAVRHRDDVMAGRTLTQHAVPITFGLKVAGWLDGVVDARSELRGLRWPVQLGGAAGTLAAVVELTGDVDAALSRVRATARALSLDDVPPWHTVRTPLTRYADALVRTTDALGHAADDVLTLARPEIGELAEGTAEGRGGSSTMPHKQNPVLAVLVRRAALAGPVLAAQVHLAAADVGDERPAGAWHTEWSALATLSRRTLVAASQTAELAAGLRVDPERMAARADDAAGDLLAEQATMAGLSGRPVASDPRAYLGASAALVHRAVERARRELEEHP